MKNSVWCVRTHMVDDYETISDDVRLFKSIESAENVFNSIVEEERRIANEEEWVISCDDNREFEAYLDGYFSRDHSCVSLFEIEIE